MSVGNTFKQSFQQIFQLMGGTVLIHKHWGTPQQTTLELRGLKNSEKGHPQNVMFQFPDRIDAIVGDVIQQKGAQDLWRVVDVEDHIHGDVYVNYKAKVEKLNGPNKHSPPPGTNVIVHGSNYGGIQVAGPQSTQNMTVDNLQIAESLKHLRTLGTQLPISDLDKEDLGLAIDRIEELARKQKSGDVVAKIKEKLEFVEKIFSVSKDAAALALPYIGILVQALCQ